MKSSYSLVYSLQMKPFLASLAITLGIFAISQFIILKKETLLLHTYLN